MSRNTSRKINVHEAKGHSVAGLDRFRANVPAVKEEDGCIEYGATVDADGVGGFQTRYGDDTFVIIENWASRNR